MEISLKDLTGLGPRKIEGFTTVVSTVPKINVASGVESPVLGGDPGVLLEVPCVHQH